MAHINYHKEEKQKILRLRFLNNKNWIMIMSLLCDLGHVLKILKLRCLNTEIKRTHDQLRL